MASLELYGRQVASGVVATPGVIEHLNVVEDIGPGLTARRIDLSANALSLEQLEEALCDCVVMAVAAPAHAAHQVVIAQEALPVMAGELAALVGMHGDRRFGLAPPQSHQQSIEGQFGIDAVSHGPTDDMAREQIDHHAQIQPALAGTDVGDVRDPGLVGLADDEASLQVIGGDHGRLATTTCRPPTVARLGAQPLELEQTNTRCLPHVSPRSRMSVVSLR